ncbi:MAG TPA: hypothetical protein VD835_08865 [Pyrinomonadaceae bacterium]|nr:hypothetical protein [Pyrinomonadaceae bacterium]
MRRPVERARRAGDQRAMRAGVSQSSTSAAIFRHPSKTAIKLSTGRELVALASYENA